MLFKDKIIVKRDSTLIVFKRTKYHRCAICRYGYNYNCKYVPLIGDTLQPDNTVQYLCKKIDRFYNHSRKKYNYAVYSFCKF